MDLLCSAVDHSCLVSRQVDNLQEGIDSGSKGYLDKHRTGVCASLVHFAPCLVVPWCQSWLSPERAAAPAQASEHGGAHAEPAASLLTSICTSSPCVLAARASQAQVVPEGSALVPTALCCGQPRTTPWDDVAAPPPCSAAGCSCETAFLVHDPYRSPRSQALPTREAQQSGRKRRRKRLTPCWV